MIAISAKTMKGFWRCGVLHTFEQVEYDDKAFTKEQLEILKAEPMLAVFESAAKAVVAKAVE